VRCGHRLTLAHRGSPATGRAWMRPELQVRAHRRSTTRSSRWCVGGGATFGPEVIGTKHVPSSVGDHRGGGGARRRRRHRRRAREVVDVAGVVLSRPPSLPMPITALDVGPRSPALRDRLREPGEPAAARACRRRRGGRGGRGAAQAASTDAGRARRRSIRGPRGK
jgi:hypothetical protein